MNHNKFSYLITSYVAYSLAGNALMASRMAHNLTVRLNRIN